MGIVGCVMLYHGCWDQSAKLTFDLTSQTQIFDTNKYEHMLLTERVVWIWVPYQN